MLARFHKSFAVLDLSRTCRNRSAGGDWTFLQQSLSILRFPRISPMVLRVVFAAALRKALFLFGSIVQVRPDGARVRWISEWSIAI